MNELPPDVERLRVIRMYLELQLAAVDAKIEQATAAARPTAATARPARDEQPFTRSGRGWRLESIPPSSGKGAGRGVVHRGDCPAAAGGWLSRKELDVALDQPEVTACPKCRPGTALPEERAHTSGVRSFPGRFTPQSSAHIDVSRDAGA
ncbi:DUF6233 domain-containing protein [Actinacidiphila glaucinigra]|uniref:DUF6233 domain-containing protein n=1 Tax=Actinacidiphila glaucinigra TaxID=235986 RepID=UPI003D8C8EA5